MNSAPGVRTPGQMPGDSPPDGTQPQAGSQAKQNAAPPAKTESGGTLRAAATRLNLVISDTQVQQLLAYQALLQRWNKVYNLTALRSADEMLTHHLLDSLAALPPLLQHMQHNPPERPGTPPRLLDVGSGGGLPGVVLAIMQPGWQVDCVDTVAKKASFIRQVAAELRLANLQGLHSRVEKLPATAPGYHLITARAFASLADLTQLTQHLLGAAGCWAAMKGRHPDEELRSLPASISVFHVEQLQVPHLNADRCIVWMRPVPATGALAAANPAAPTAGSAGATA